MYNLRTLNYTRMTIVVVFFFLIRPTYPWYNLGTPEDIIHIDMINIYALYCIIHLYIT